jgi:hypothetical protein
MLTLGALGRDKELVEARKLYEYHKDDEDAMTVTALFKQRHPAANNEAQAIHAHRLWPVDAKSSSSQPKTSFYNMLSIETKPLPKAAGSLR